MRPKTVIDVFNAPQLGIASIEKEFGELWLRALMVKWMNAFLKFYSVNGTMDGLQVADTINLIIEEYSHYTQEDFKLFFNMAKKGRFTQIFGRVDGDVIMRWLEEYDLHRRTEAQRLSIKDAEKFKPRYQTDSEDKDSDYVSYAEYLEIKKLADSGDESAIKRLKRKK